MPLSKVNRPGLNTGIADSSDATAITIDSSERVGIGAAPAAKLHVQTSAVNSSIDNVADDFVIENNGASGMTVLSANNDSGFILFGDNDYNAAAGIRYEHANSAMSFRVNSAWDRLRIDSAGRVTMPQQPTFHGHFNAVFGANSSIGNRITAHIATVQNVGNMFNSSNTRWTVPVAGQYLFHVTVMKSGNNTAAGHLDLSFNGQGANVEYRVRMSEGATYDQPSMTVVRNMAANDYMELYYYGTPNIHSEHSSIVVRLLG